MREAATHALLRSSVALLWVSTALLGVAAVATLLRVTTLLPAAAAVVLREKRDEEGIKWSVSIAVKTKSSHAPMPPVSSYDRPAIAATSQHGDASLSASCGSATSATQLPSRPPSSLTRRSTPTHILV